jgi:hypothetical protein
MIVTNLNGFTDDAVKAMQASPDYFVHWYTAKSILLVGAIAWIAYTAGAIRANRPRRDSRW